MDSNDDCSTDSSRGGGEVKDNHMHNRKHGQQHSMNKSGGKGSTINSDYNKEKDRHQRASYVQMDEAKQVRLRAEKRIRDLEDKVEELEAENKQLRVELKRSMNKYWRSSKEDMRNDNEWNNDEAILAGKIDIFTRDVLFPRYKFLNVGWQNFEPNNNKSLSYYVGCKLSDTYRHMRIVTLGDEFEDQWNKVYVPVIKTKYKHMRTNIGNDVRDVYMRE